jgi:hypothetical protein
MERLPFIPAKADPRPCARCGHRTDMHERYKGSRACRACNWIALRWPCSWATIEAESVLDSLTFEEPAP